MNLYELRCLPDELGVQEVGFYAAGLNPVTDSLMLLWMIFGLYKYQWSLRLGAKLGSGRPRNSPNRPSRRPFSWMRRVWSITMQSGPG